MTNSGKLVFTATPVFGCRERRGFLESFDIEIECVADSHSAVSTAIPSKESAEPILESEYVLNLLVH